MALFSQKQNTEKEEAIVKAEKTPVVNNSSSLDYNLSRVVKGLRITEKAVNLGDRNVYTFNISRDATKYQIRDAIKFLYNVTPVRINIVNKKPSTRTSGSRTRAFKVKGTKKAYVYLKEGDTINLV